MLEITIPAAEQWDERDKVFVYTKEQTLRLEHSLVSLSKWEEKWNKAFISNKQKTREETLYYIRCMTITQNVPEEVYKYIPDNILAEIHEYIDAPMTATHFPDNGVSKKGTQKEAFTAEVIYYYMISYGIPVEFQKWHLNKLLTLIRVFDHKNSPPKKMGREALLSRNKALNEARRKQLNSKG